MSQQRRYHFLQWEEEEMVAIHTFDLGYYDKGWYWAITSLDCFATREATRMHEAIRKYGNWGDAYKATGRRMQFIRDWDELPDVLREVYDGLPQRHHTSVWEMYIAVAYHYKKQRYVHKETQCSTSSS